VRRRLVSRTRSPEDGRRVMLALTSSGRALLRSAPEVAQIRLIAALRALPQRDLAALARLLARIVRTMGVSEPAGLLFDEIAPHSRWRPRRKTAVPPRRARPR